MRATFRTPSAARAPTRGAKTILARAVSLVLIAAEREGLSRQVLLEAAGLAEPDIADPDARLPVAAQIAVWQVVAKAISDPGFGVRTGAATRVRDYGLLGYAIYFSGNLGAALRRLVRYLHLLTDAVNVSAVSSNQDHIAMVEEQSALGVGLPPAVDSRLAAIVAGCREITGVNVTPARVDFTYRQPASILEHRRFFRCPLRFLQPRSQVEFHRRDLALPVLHADESLAGYLSEHAEEVLQGLTTGTSLRDDVRATIWALLCEGPPALKRVAGELDLSPRTLQRQLALQGTSLRAEVEHIRQGMATAALQEGTRSVEEIAFLLGYAETSTFYRSFRRWTGSTPHQYRAEAMRAARRHASRRSSRRPS
jgi:AraC-like DNA-binding protein